jgi:3-hydroxymyristoyl/3-hydroxydecanoyl-(acyl carrier protein) dehydratase
VIEAHEIGGGWRLRLDVPEDSPCCRGHFPGQPVVPGVVLLGWALTLAHAAWPGISDRGPGRDQSSAQRVTQLKFRRPVRPPAALTLDLVRKEDRLQFSYELASPSHKEAPGGQARCAEGRVRWP